MRMPHGPRLYLGVVGLPGLGGNMAVATPDVAIPATVTIDGETIAEILVLLFRAERELGSCEELCMGITTLFHAAFGNIYLECECNLHDCPICNGSEETDGTTPLYRLVVERALEVAA
jgi:hypothetical protein